MAKMSLKVFVDKYGKQELPSTEIAELALVSLTRGELKDAARKLLEVREEFEILLEKYGIESL